MKPVELLERVEAETPASTQVVPTRWAVSTGRWLDLAVLALVSPVAMPLAMLLFVVNAIAFLSLRESFFRQPRIGLEERPFLLWKFRTMRSIAPSRLPWSHESDALRVTRLGRFLRCTHLDELPQLWNVLRGDMRLIGPRPEMTNIVDWAKVHAPSIVQQFSVRPGLTGRAQVTQGYVGLDARGYTEKIRINLDYIQSASLRVDLGILARTFVWMAVGRGWNWKPVETLRPVQRGASAMARGLVSRLIERDVAFVVLRGERVLDGDLSGDIDLLVDPGDLRRLEEHIEVLVQGHGARVVHRRHSGFLQQWLFATSCDRGALEFLALDIHTSEAVFGVPVLGAAELLHAASIDRVPRLHPADSALVDLLGPLAGGGVAPTRAVEAARRAHAAHRTQLCARASELLGERQSERFLQLLQGPTPALAKAGRSIRYASLRRAFGRRPISSLRALISFAISVRVAPLVRPVGRFVVFLGTDGSGKSTLAARVVDRLGPAFRDGGTGVVHLRPGLLPQINALFHGGRTTYSLADMSRPHRAQPSGRIGSTARVAYYWLDHVVGYAVRILPRRRRRSFVAFDRYFYDYLVDPERSRVRRGTWLARVLSHALPKPDAVFVCSADPERIHARKPELPIEEVRRQVREYEELARERGFHIVHTDGSIEQSVEQVIHTLFRPANPA